MRNRIPLELFAGQTPGAVAQYRLAGLAGAFADPSILGIAFFAMALADLDSFRSIEEYATYQGNLRSRIKEIDSQFIGQPLDDVTRTEWADLNDIDKEIDTRLKELRARAARVEAMAQQPDRVERGSDTGREQVRAGSSTHGRRVPEDVFAVEQYRSLARSEEDQGNLMIDGALMVIGKARFPHEGADQEAIRGDLESLFTRIDDPVRLARHILVTGSPTYGRALLKYAGQRDLYADENRMLYGSNVRAQTLGTDSAGGYAVPFQLDPTLILTSDGQRNPLRQISRTERITGKKWEGLTTAGVSAQYESSEVAEVGASSITLTQPNVDTALADVFIPYSITLDLAWGALQAELARVIQDAKDALESTKFVTGTGTNEPHGIAATLDSGQYVYIGSGLQTKDLYSVTDALVARFEASASWIARKTFYSKVRQLSVGTVGEGTVWLPGVGPGHLNPPTLVGSPAYVASGMAAFSANNIVAIYGDFSNFLIVDRIGLTVEVVPIVFGASQRPTNQRGVYAYWMNQSLILVQKAFQGAVVGGGGS